jgi:hypothetical protein
MILNEIREKDVARALLRLKIASRPRTVDINTRRTEGASQKGRLDLMKSRESLKPSLQHHQRLKATNPCTRFLARHESGNRTQVYHIGSLTHRANILSVRFMLFVVKNLQPSLNWPIHIHVHDYRSCSTLGFRFFPERRLLTLVNDYSNFDYCRYDLAAVSIAPFSSLGMYVLWLGLVHSALIHTHQEKSSISFMKENSYAFMDDE